MIIKGLNIFITWKQYNEILTENVREKLDKLPSIDSTNFEKVLKMKDRILFDELDKKFNRKEKAIEFLNQWMKFDLIGTEAQENTWNLLNDYCIKNNFAFLKDNRSFDDKLKADYIGESYGFYPLGKEFSLICIIPERKNWFGKRIGYSSEIEILIEIGKVTRIEGEFKSLFTIYTLKNKYVFGRGISVLPCEE